MIAAYAPRARRRHGLRPHRRLAQLGRDAALVRARHHERIRAPDRAQPAWHTDRPSGEVIATLETSTWAFVELIDTMAWGILRISVTTLGAIVVLGIVAWPVALVMVGLVAVFVGVLHRRMGRVVAAEKDFSDAHSRATGVIADTIANLTTVRSQAAEELEMGHVGELVGESLRADFRARRVFTTTRLQMESALAVLQLGRGRGGDRAGAAPRGGCRRGLLDLVLRHLRGNAWRSRSSTSA